MSTVESRMSDALETIEALAEQNRMLRSSLNLLYSWANNWDSEFMNDPEWRNQDCPIIQAAVALPDLSTSILNQRDARTLREAATRFTEEQHPGIWHKLKEMAAEKEKQ